MSANILIILGHPSLTSLNAALADAYEESARDAGANVRRLNLTELEFDLVYRGASQPLERDLQHAQGAIIWADHIVWLFPLWWGNQPALLRGFIDRTFQAGWAYNTKENGMPIQHLAGRTARTVVTMDAPWWFYRFWYARAAHRAMERATLWYCGIDVKARNTLHGIDKSTVEQRQEWLDELRAAARVDVARLAKRLSSKEASRALSA